MAKKLKPKTAPRKKAKSIRSHSRAQRAVTKHAASKTQLQYTPWSTIPLEDLNPLLQRQFVVGQEIMLARVLLKKGCIVPEHSHHNEQLTYVLDGALKFSIDGREIVELRRSKTRSTSTFSIRRAPIGSTRPTNICEARNNLPLHASCRHV
jgi:quercetin dioxygenase-like cupin family protein